MGGAASLVSGKKNDGDGGQESASRAGSISNRSASRKKSVLQRASSAAAKVAKEAITKAGRAAESAANAVQRTTSQKEPNLSKAFDRADAEGPQDAENEEPVGMFDGDQSEGSGSETAPALDRSAFAGKIRIEEKEDEDPDAVPADSPSGSKLMSPIPSSRGDAEPEEIPSDAVQQERQDLGGPQRYLVTVIESEGTTLEDGQVMVRLSLGKRWQDSKKHVCGDRLIQGIVRVWTGKVRFNEEFYFEVWDPDSFILLEFKHLETGRDPKTIGEARLHAKKFSVDPKDEWHDLGEPAGRILLKCAKVRRSEEADNEGDDQAVMSALQKHTSALTTMVRLSVRVIQAVDIPAMDDAGTSDPYVLLVCGHMKKRTKVIMKTMHPQWHEDFDFFFPAGSALPNMELEMWDRDSGAARDDLIGKATVAIAGLTDFRQRQEWVKMQNGGEETGKLQLYLGMEQKTGGSDSALKDLILQWYYSEDALMTFWEEMSGGVSGKKAADGGADPDELPPALIRVTVLRAKDLLAKDRGGTSDPYVRLHIGEDLLKAKKTAVKPKTLNPTWMEKFEFAVPGSQRREAMVVECFDKDTFGTDDSLGKFGIPLDTLAPDKEYRDWYSFDKATDDSETNNGQLELQVTMTEVTPDAAETKGDAGRSGSEGRRKSQIRSMQSQAEMQGIHVIVVGGRGMPKMDTGLFGKCDPYLKLECGGAEKQTKVVKRSLAPTWNENFTFALDSHERNQELKVECYDYDMVGEHDFIGGLSLNTNDLKMRKSDWFKLVHPDNPGFNAEVFLTITPVFESIEEMEQRKQKQMEEAEVEAQSTVLTIDVVAARGLEAMDSGGTSDPYTIVQVGSEKRKTKVIKKDLNPEWNDKFELMVTDVNDSLRVQVWDKDLVGADDLIGETMVPLSTFVGQKLAQKWYSLYKESRITGEVLLGMKLPRPEGYVAPGESLDGSASISGGIVSPETSLESVEMMEDGCCPPHVRVYVSGTLSDLAQERHLLHDNVLPEIRRYCESRCILCLSVDVRMGLVVENQEMVKLCLDELDKSTVFLCFLGEKYGFRLDNVDDLLPTRPWIEALKGKSMVEVELAAAIINNPEKFHNRAFVYMRNQLYIDSVPGIAREDYAEEDPQYALALEAVKKRLKAIEGLPVVENYADPHSVMPQIRKDLRMTVNKMYPKKVRKRLLTLQRATLLQHCREPVNYYYLDSDIAQRLNNYIAFDERCVLNVVGPQGSGKTSLLKTWVNRYEKTRNKDVFLFPHFDLGASGVESARGILRRILLEMKKQFGIEAEVPTNYIQIKRTFLVWLRIGTAKGGVCIVIDGADGLDEPNDGIAALLGCIPKILPRGLRLILSMETGSSAFDQVCKRVNFSKTLAVGALSIKARKSICEEMLARHGRAVKDLDERLFTNPEMRSPLFLRTSMDYFIRTEIFLPGTPIRETVANLLELVEAEFAKDTPELVELVLCSVARSRRGLTDAEIMAVSGVSRSTWARLAVQLQDMLCGLSGLINFHHDLVDECVCERYMPSEEQKQKATMRLARFFQDLPLSFRKVEELPWLLAENARYWIQFAQPSEYRQVWKKLRDCLVDMDMFQAMYHEQYESDLHDFWGEMNGVYDSVEEYTASIEGYESKSAQGVTDRIIPSVHVAECKTKLAKFFFRSSRFDSADAMYLAAIEGWKLCPGRELKVAALTLELGEMRLGWGKFDLAEATLKQAVVLLEEMYGFNHELVGQGLHLTAEAMRRQKKEAEAVSFSERAFQVLDDRLEKSVKESSPLYARCSYTMGVLYEILDKLGLSEKAYERSVAVFEKALGAGHPESCQAKECLAGVYHAQGDLTKAAACYQELLPVKEEMSALGATLGDVTTTQNNLAAVFVQLNDLRAAEVMYRKTISIREHQYGHTHPTVARSLEMLANLLGEMGHLKDSALLLQRALNIRTRIYGKDHMETAATMVNLSAIQCRRGQFQVGRDLFKRWIRIMLQALGASHPTSVWALNWLDRWPDGGAPGGRVPKKGQWDKEKQLPGGKMMVTVIRGRGLLAMDKGQSSDPYIVVQFSGQKKKTWPKMQTLNPEWNEKMEFTVSEDDRKNGEIVFQCFDKDVMGEDDDMGRFTMRMQDVPLAQLFREWRTFDDPEKTGEIEIEIFLQEDTVPSPRIKVEGKAPKGSLLQQMEAKERRDQLRANKRREEQLESREQSFRDAARNRINNASAIKIAKEQRRQAKIAAGLDPDAEDEEEDLLATGDGEQEGEQGEEEQAEVKPEEEEEEGLDGEGEGEGEGEEEGGEPKASKLVSLDTDAQELMESAAAEEQRVDEQGAQPLHFAAMSGKEDKVVKLLQEGARPNTRDADGLTPMHYAAGDGHVGIVAMLCDGGADLMTADSEGDLPLHIAVQENQMEVLTFFLTRQPDLVKARGAWDNTPLHLAAGTEADRSDMVRFLLVNGADPLALNEDGESALDLAERVTDTVLNHPHYQIIRDHLGMDGHASTIVDGGLLKPAIAEKLWSYIETGDVENVLKFLRGGLDIDGRLDTEGLTALMLATDLQQEAIVKELADAAWGADCNLKTTNGLTAMHFAVLPGERASLDIVHSLLTRNPNCNAIDHKCYSPLHYACERAPVEVLQELVEAGGADLAPITRDGHTMLHLAAYGGKKRNIEYLLSKMKGTSAGNFTFVNTEQALHAVVNRLDKAGNTALHILASSDDNLDAAQLLLDSGANPCQVNKEGQTPEDIARQAKQGLLMDLLGRAAEERADASEQAMAKALMLLSFAVQDGDVEALQQGLEAGGADINSPVDEVGDTLLHTAASHGAVDMMKTLVEYGSFLFAKNSLGCTPMHAAAMGGKSDAVRWLMSHGGEPRDSDSEGYCPMHYAAGEGHLETVRVLVEEGRVDETLKTFSGLTLLHIAVTERHRAVVEWLLKRRPQLAVMPDADGALPIDFARSAKVLDEDIIKLLEAGSTGSRLMVIMNQRQPEAAGKLLEGAGPMGLKVSTASTDAASDRDMVGQDPDEEPFLE